MVNPQISYFAIYDGHGGNKCSNFLQENLHKYIFESDYFPLYPLQAIYQAYDQAEKNFEKLALDMANKKLLDKSGSCALSALIVDDYCFVTNLGDSRGLYSFDTGKQLFQITRDHKPNDSTEKKRIEKAGGKIYKDTRVKVDGVKVKVNAEEAPGFKFPYRVSPGNLAVSIFIFIF
jgi:protein phosphatase 2C family protein 2/3